MVNVNGLMAKKAVGGRGGSSNQLVELLLGVPKGNGTERAKLDFTLLSRRGHRCIGLSEVLLSHHQHQQEEREFSRDL